MTMPLQVTLKNLGSCPNNEFSEIKFTLTMRENFNVSNTSVIEDLLKSKL